MMKKFRLNSFAALTVLLSAVSLPLFSAPAHAFVQLNLIGGVSFLEGTAHDNLTVASPLVGANLLFAALPGIDIGPIFEDNLINNHGSLGHRAYYGGVARITVGPIVFIDGTLGATNINYGTGGGTSDLAFAGGLDIGLNWGFLRPFVGYRYTPTHYGSSSTDGNTIDLGMMFSL